MNEKTQAQAIAEIQERHKRHWLQCRSDSFEGHALSMVSEMYPAITTLLHALAESQRDNATLRKERDDFQQTAHEFSDAITALQSPPQERRGIVERQECRKECLANGDAFGAVVATRDIDTLLQDLCRYRNSHDVLLAERDDAKQRLTTSAEQLDQRIELDKTSKARIEELEVELETSQSDLRKLVDLVWNECTESQQVPSTEWADQIIGAWRTALAAGDVPQPADLADIINPAAGAK